MKKLLEQFVSVPDLTGYDFQAQQIIKENMGRIKNKKDLLRVYNEQNLPFDYMDSKELDKIWNRMMMQK